MVAAAWGLGSVSSGREGCWVGGGVSPRDLLTASGLRGDEGVLWGWCCLDSDRGRRRRGCPRPWPGRAPPPTKAHHPEAAAAAAAAGSVARGMMRSWLGGQTEGRTEAAGSPCSRSPSDPRGHTLLRPAPAGSGNPAQEEEDGEAGEGQPRVRRPLEHSGPPKLPSVPRLRPGPSP